MIYCPLNKQVENEMFTEFFQLLDSKFIAGGDSNSKHYHWGSRLITPRGIKLKEVIDRFNYNVPITGNLTHWPMDINKVQDVLDFFVYKGVAENYMEVEENYDMEGSHLPVSATVSMTVVIVCNF